MSDAMTMITVASFSLAGLSIATFAGLQGLAGLARGQAARAGRQRPAARRAARPAT